MFCSHCGSPNDDAAKFCQKCGKALGADVPQSPPAAPVPDGRMRDTQAATTAGRTVTGKNPVLAAVLSLIPGVGQFYNGDNKKGAVMLGILIVGNIVTLGLGGLVWLAMFIEQQIGRIGSAAVFVGAAGIGPWQEQELYGFLREFVARRSAVIPVCLMDAPDQPELPIFLRAMTWVDFRLRDPDPMERLIWGITGKRASAE